MGDVYSERYYEFLAIYNGLWRDPFPAVEEKHQW
jgi:hypothetical protein